MKQLSIFSNGGETKKEVVGLNTYNSDDLIKNHFEKKQLLKNKLEKEQLEKEQLLKNKLEKEQLEKEQLYLYNNTFYKSADVDADLTSMVDSDDFFKDNSDSDEFYVCVDYLKKNKNDEYKKINISDIKHIGLNKHLPVNKYLEINKAYGGSVNQEKVAKVMHEFKKGKLHSSSGDLVTNRKQAIAIALSEAIIDKKEKGGYIIPPTKEKGGYITPPTKTREPKKVNSAITDFNLQHFYKYMESELKYFLKDTLGADLRSDGVFIFNKQMYYIRPYFRKTSDGKILKEANLSIQTKGREVGEITFDPSLGDKKFVANSQVFGWDKTEFKAGGVAYTIPFDYKILGVYQVLGKNLNEKIEIVGFEKQNDTSYSFYQPLYGGANKKIGSLIVPNTKIRNVSNGKTVFVETSKGDKVKIKRLGSVNDGILFD